MRDCGVVLKFFLRLPTNTPQILILLSFSAVPRLNPYLSLLQDLRATVLRYTPP